MVHTEVTTEGMGSRLGGAIKGVIGGGILFLAAFPMLWMNEGCAVDQYKKIGEAEKAVVEVPAEKVDSAFDGKLIHISGKAETQESLSDTAFGVTKVAIQLRRDVEMYQVAEIVETREEKKVGGKVEKTKTYRYEERWSSSLIDSSNFNEIGFDKSGYPNNPKSFPVDSMTLKANKVNVGAFSLSTGLIDSYNKFSDVAVDDAKPTRSGVKKSGGGFYLGADPNSPAIGDTRVKFQAALPGPASIMAQQNGSALGPWASSMGPVEWLVEDTMTSAQMIKAQRDAVAMLTWILRLVGFLMMLFGLVAVFKPLSVMGDVIPFIGSMIGGASFVVAFLIAMIFSSMTIAVAWIAHRPLVAIPLLLLVVGGVVALVVLKKKKGAAKAA